MVHSSWKHLHSVSEYLEAVKNSEQTDVLIFKHSTRCGVSAQALDKLVSNWDIAEGRLEVYYLDLISYRSVSDFISEHTSIRHQSPQIILFQSGKPVYNTSHFRIGMPTILDLIS